MGQGSGSPSREMHNNIFELFCRYWNFHQVGEVNCMLPTSTVDSKPAGWWCWLELIMSFLNYYYKTPHYPLSGWNTQFWGHSLVVAPFAWQVNRAPLFYSIQICLWDLIQCQDTGAEFTINISSCSFPGDSVIKNLTAMQEMQDIQVSSLGQEDALEKEMATHSSIFAWEIPWAEKPGGLWSMGSQSQTRLKQLSMSTHFFILESRDVTNNYTDFLLTYSGSK